MVKYILLFLLIPSLCFGQVLVKPNIAQDKLLTESEQIQVKSVLWKKDGIKLIHKELIPAKNDYINDDNRGTVLFNNTKIDKKHPITQQVSKQYLVRNYAKHKVIIPDNTVVDCKQYGSVNFSQKIPFTKAIIGKNLTFIGCNLTNNYIDQTWTLIDSNNSQIKTRQEIILGKKYIIQEAFVKGTWKEVGRYEVD